jgi:ATP phosphoribosyltransferase
MYSVTELSKMFHTSRPTIYRKLKSKSLQHYISDTDKGKMLSQEGLNAFQLIMADSKVISNDTEQKHHHYSNDTEQLIDSLREQIEELKKDKLNMIEDKKELLNQINTKEKQLDNTLTLLKDSQNKILLLSEVPKTKKTWWKFWRQ